MRGRNQFGETLCPEDWGSTILSNASRFIPDYTTLPLTRRPS